MKTIRKIVTTLAMAVSAMTATGVSAKTALNIYEVGNAQPVGIILLDDQPEVVFTDGMMKLSASRADIFVSLRFDRIDHWEFSEASSSSDIDKIHQQAPATLRFYYINEHEVLIGNLPDDDNYVTVYDTGGRRISADVVVLEGMAHVSLTTLPRGIYIIKTKSQSFKIRKK